MDLKRKILESCEVTHLKSKGKKTKKWLKPNILKWLDGISKGQKLCGVKRF